MKKSLIIMFVMLIFIACLTTIVYADGTPVTISGDETITPGGTKELSVNVNSSEDIGIISGIITTSERISSYTVTAQNGWNLTFNKNTGEFNIYKAEGAKAEAIMTISYTVSDNEGTATVSLTELRVTTIKYDEDEPADVVKPITITATGTNPGTEPENDEGSNQGKEQKDDQPNKQQNNSNTSQKDNTNKTEDNTKSDKSIVKAGKEDIIIIIASASVLGAISFVGYKKYINI